MDALFPALEHLLGFLVVVVALAGLWGLTSLNSLLITRLKTAPATPPPKNNEERPPETKKKPEIPDEAFVAAAAIATLEHERDTEALVVIAATVASMLGEKHRIVSIRPRASNWGQQGRREIHASHRLR